MAGNFVFVFGIFVMALVRNTSSIKCYSCVATPSEGKRCTDPNEWYLKDCPEAKQCFKTKNFQTPEYGFQYVERRDCHDGDGLPGCSDLEHSFPHRTCICDRDLCNAAPVSSVNSVAIVTVVCVGLIAKSIYNSL